MKCMTQEDLNQIRGVVREEISTAIEPVVKKLDTLWDQTVTLTEDMTEIKETQKLHTTAFKRLGVKVENDSEDIKKADKRLTHVETHLGIVPPPELAIAR